MQHTSFGVRYCRPTPAIETCEQSDRFPNLRLLLAGAAAETRCTRFLERPPPKLGIADEVLQAVYCRDYRLVSADRAMDVFVYLYVRNRQVMPNGQGDHGLRCSRCCVRNRLPIRAD